MKKIETKTKSKVTKVVKPKGPCRNCKKKPEITELPDLIIEEPIVIQDLSEVYIPNLNEIRYLYQEVIKGVKEDNRERISNIYTGLFQEPFNFTSDLKIDSEQGQKIQKLVEELKLYNYSDQELKVAYLEMTNPLGIKQSSKEMINKIYIHLFDEPFDFDCRDCRNKQVAKYKNYLTKHNIKRI